MTTPPTAQAPPGAPQPVQAQQTPTGGRSRRRRNQLLVGLACLVVAVLLPLTVIWLAPTTARRLSVFVVAFCVLLAPGIVVGYQWQARRRWVALGVLVGAIVAAVGIWSLGDITSWVLPRAVWIIEHRVLSAAIGLAAALAVAATAIALLHRRRTKGRMSDRQATVVASSLGVIGGIALMVVLVLGLTWQGRYGYSTDVDVPELAYDVGPYVALGDSYAAGEGLGPFFNEDACHRSRAFAFSELLRYQGQPILDSRDELPSLLGGAVARQVYEFAQNAELGIQVPATLLSPETGLVTIVMGGNDVHFSDVLKFCVLTPNCLHAPFSVGSPGPDEISDIASGDTLGGWADSMLGVLDARLTTMLTSVRADVSPTTRVIVVGYPHLLPNGRVPRQFNYCDGLMALLPQDERDQIFALHVRLNQTIAGAASRTGVEFIDPTLDFDQHEVCGIHGELIHSKNLSLDDPGMFHPTVKGQRLLARQVVCYLNAHPPTADDAVRPPTADRPATTTAAEKMSSKDTAICPDVEHG